MLQLVLMRHAKSGWDDPALADIDRPLADRGKKDAPRIARWLAERSCVPQRILCSPARRTQETAQRVIGEWPEKVELCVERALYLAHAEEILRMVRCTDSGVARLMVIGHNPGIGVLVYQLGGRVEPKFPTAAVAIFKIDADDWGEVWRDVTLAAQTAPKELAS